MNAPPTVRRSPRLIRPLPKDPVIIPAPPELPAPPAGNVVNYLTPIITILVIISIMVMLSWNQTLLSSLEKVRGVAVAASLAFAGSFAMLAVYVISLYTHRIKNRQREEKYRQVLAESAKTLEKVLAEQRTLRLQMDPTPQQCLAQVKEQQRAVWARLPDDEDFLRMRIGIGRQPSTVEIKVPAKSDSRPDPLIDAAHQLCDAYSEVKDVPICLPIQDAGVVGVVGARAESIALNTLLLIQLATNHAYDVVKVALFYPAAEAEAWRWARWLPHLWHDDRSQRYLANDPMSAEQLATTVEDELLRREQQQPATPVLPHWIILVADLALLERRPVFQRLLTTGPTHGLYVICLAERVRTLPPNCRLIVHLDAAETRLLWREPTLQAQRFTPDAVAQTLAIQMATAMAPLRLQQGGVATIPQLVSLFELLEARTIETLNVTDRWQHSATAGRSLAAPLGLCAGNRPLLLDLHEQADGPNGLVAGMVGAGKSELLQTLVATLAVNFHPHRLAFVLIDYKGGGTMQPLTHLPHTLGVITNLQDGELAMRALTSLRVDLERRQRLFNAAGVNHIDQYQHLYDQQRVPDPLPYLVIIVDEFAEMRDDQPDLAGEFVRIARTGRAFGMRLILAMQKSAGIVDDQIEANTRFRICLRVAQVEDSQAMLKRPDAAYLTGQGRAYFQVGVGQEFTEFQVAWSGAEWNEKGQTLDDDLAIVEIGLDGRRRRLGVAAKAATAFATTQLQALVAHLQRVAAQEKIVPLAGLWLPPLPECLYLAQLFADASADTDGQPRWTQQTHWMTPVIGLLDEPQARRQQPLRLPLGKQGHLLVYGAPGAGKTTFLQTLILSLAYEHSPADLHLYVLDYGSRRLKPFEQLPQVGGVLLPDEQERLERLLRMLVTQLDERQRQLGRRNAANLSAYRAASGERLPALFLIIDNYSNFAEITQSRPEVYALLLRLARDGGACGIHLVLTANSAASVRFDLSTNFLLTVALPLVEVSDYTVLVGRLVGISPPTTPGRGLLRGNPPLVFQTALPAVSGSERDVDYNAALTIAMTNMKALWRGEPASPIPVMPAVLRLSELGKPLAIHPPTGDLAASVGLYVENLAPLLVNLQTIGHLLITGLPRSGKSTLLHTCLLAMAQQLPPTALHFYVLDSKRRKLQLFAQHTHLQAYAATPQAAEPLLETLLQICQARRQQQTQPAVPLPWPHILVAVDDLLDPFDDNLSERGKENLTTLLRQGQGLGIHVVVTSAANDVVAKGWLEPIRSLREAQIGFMLGSSEDMVFNLRLPYVERNRLLPPGEGYYVERNLAYRVKIALPDQ